MSKNIFHSNEKFLDFKDVLILPKSSKLNSRKDVNLERTFEFTAGSASNHSHCAASPPGLCKLHS